MTKQAKHSSQRPAHHSAHSNGSRPYRDKGSVSIVNGTLAVTSQGYGFVRPDNGEGPDIFIPAHEIHGALTLDYVQIQVDSPRGKRTRGRIVKILRPRSLYLVGEAIRDRSYWFLSEKKSRRQFPLKVPNGAEVLPGNLVIAHRAFNKNQSVAIFHKTVDPHSFSQCAEVVLAEFGFSHDFPPEVEEEMRTVQLSSADALGLPRKARRDLRKKAFVTIDGKDARDFDDAVYAERKKSGAYTLWVSIADVSAFVKEGSLCDEEAKTRGTSTYFPDFCIPMLPERLSNHLCSLVPHEERLTFTVEIDLDPTGKVTKSDLYPSIILSKARLTYESAQAFLDGNEAPSLTADIESSLKNLAELAKILADKRHARGSLDFDLPEAVFKMGDNRQIADVRPAVRLFSHRLIEECMILANEVVADWLEHADLPGLYRIHENPDPEEIAQFLAFLDVHAPEPPEAKREFRESQKKEAEKIPRIITPKQVQKWIEHVKGTPQEPFLMKLLLRSLKQAIYDDHNAGHFGLASESYTHFTSPIRRYPDLYIHRVLRRYLMKPKQKPKAPKIPLGAPCSYRERVSMETEREMRKLYSAYFMQDKVGRVLSGKISHTAGNGVYVLFDDYFVEGHVPKSFLDPEAVFEEKALSWRLPKNGKRLEIGARIAVRVEKVDFWDRYVLLAIQ